jgi:hypothetical protein
MNLIKVVAIGIVLATVGCFGCKSNPSSGSAGNNGSGSASLQDKNPLCNPHCEGIAYVHVGNPGQSRPLQLQSAEESSLKAALSSTPASGDRETLHIHADARNNQLIFLPDSSNDPNRSSHLSGDEISLSNTQKNSAAVKVVATPAALQLLKQREVNTH